jgi:ubiquinone/menaquinone biosynthesis C-methylase UbiE
MAAELLALYPGVRLTVTDVDDEMVEAAAARLSPFGGRATARDADATSLPFADDTFDVVLSWVMLHHTVEWEKALAETIRVLRPGGQLIGYDLLSTAPLRRLHRTDGDHLRMMHLPELREACRNLPVGTAVLTPSLAGLTVRFALQKAGAT